jgi:hypothetical protein
VVAAQPVQFARGFRPQSFIVHFFVVVGVRRQRLVLQIGPSYGFHLKTETESSLSNVVLKKQDFDNVNNCDSYIVLRN